VKGSVDEGRRALIEISVRSAPDSPPRAIVAWIDTAFDGELVLPSRTIQDLKLESFGDIFAVLADGTRVTLDSYLCYIDWFGELRPLQVVAKDGATSLLGTELLDGHLLQIDFRAKSVDLD